MTTTLTANQNTDNNTDQTACGARQTKNQIDEKQFNLNDEISKIYKKYRVFFAFSNKQYQESAIKCIRYVSLGSGMIAPKVHEKQVFADINKAVAINIEIELKTKGVKKIIWEQFANFEAQINYDYSDVVTELEPYGITKEQITEEWPGYIKYCNENDLY